MNSAIARSVGYVIGGLAAGIVVGTVGTTAHRAVAGDHQVPYGIVLALAVTLLGAVCMRAWGGYAPLAAYGVALVGSVQLFSLTGPGGDLLITGGTLGVAWVLGGALAVAVAFFLPRSWFTEVRHGETSFNGRSYPSRASSLESGNE